MSATESGAGEREVFECEHGVYPYRHWCQPATPDADDASERPWMRTGPEVERLLEQERADLLRGEDWCSRCNNGADVRCDACDRAPIAASTDASGAIEALRRTAMDSEAEAMIDAALSAAATRARAEGAEIGFRAALDPGSFVKRGAAELAGEPFTERMDQWQRRAMDEGLARIDRGAS